jgi:signal recognition particle receptor subunit beta
MVLINKAINEVTVKLVYYGPGLCGKTTNLEKIYGNPKLENKGKMISMATETDRTLFFDFMPMELGTIGGQKIRVQLYTVPGQVFYDATRKLVLRGADGVVFVADSQSSMQASNIDSLNNLRTNLRLNRLDPDKVAIVYQLNKRDLPNVDTVETMKEYMATGDSPVVEAAAKEGTGVTATLRAAVARMLDNLKNNVDTTLYEQPELSAPDMSARSGVTSSSAGTPKLSMKTEPPPQRPPMQTQSRPMPTPPPIAEPSPFQAPDFSSDPFASPSAPEPLAAAAVVSPFEFAPIETSAEAMEAAIEDDPFGHVAVAEAPEHDSFDDPFAAPSAEVHDGHAERAANEMLLANAQALVASLETALERAREQERILAARVSG